MIPAGAGAVAGGGGGGGAAGGSAEPGGPAAVPLARLFAIAFRDLVQGLHERLAERGWTHMRPAFGFVLLALRDRPLTTSEIGGLMGTTKQAASKLVAALAEAGYVSHLRHPEDARSKQVVLTPLGARVLAAVEDIYRELEQDWAALIGPARVDALRRDLTAVLTATHGGRLPPVRPA